MNRRDFLKLSTSTLIALSLPISARAQASGGTYYIGPLVPMSRGRAPLGSDTGEGNWILLDQDLALLWLRNPVTLPGLVKLADDKMETLSASARARLGQLTSDRAFRPQDTFHETVTRLLRQAPAGRWGNLRPSKTRQRYEIWLGPGGMGNNQFYLEPAIVGPSTKTFVDTFDRADANLNGSTSSDTLFTWLEVDGTALTIVSNAVQAAGNVSFVSARANADLDTDDHYAEGTIGTWTHQSGSTLLFAGVLTRWSSTPPPTDGYSFEVGQTGNSTYSRRIYNFSTDANIGSSDTTQTTSGTIRLETDGSSLTAKVNGTTALGPSTDTAFTGSLRTGMGFFVGAAGSTVTFSAYGTGDLVVASTARRRNPIIF